MISEFYCDECKHYNTIKLLENANGMHCVICGKCSHKHYRCINKGIMTDFRVDEKALKRFGVKIIEYVGVVNDKSWEKDIFLSPLWKSLSEGENNGIRSLSRS